MTPESCTYAGDLAQPLRQHLVDPLKEQGYNGRLLHSTHQLSNVTSDALPFRLLVYQYGSDERLAADLIEQLYAWDSAGHR